MDAVIKKIYCSLDIETSDFDPLVGEVIELGMVFFEIVVDPQTKKNIFKIISEWQSTFKPVKDVSPKILALTGITQDELEISPAFKEKFDEIQELVKDAVIVGHNINFDIKFLQGFGISFSGKKIDTLDIAQIFLPTANSYNLEALMNLLGVEHRDAHRALADSRAAMIVLEKLLKHYSSFPDALKKQLITLFTTKAGTLLPVEQPETEILHLLNLDLEPLQIIQKRPALEVNFSSEIAAQLKGEKNVISFPLGFDYHSYVYGAVKKSHEKILLVVPTKKTVFQLWQNNIGQAFFENEDLFNEQLFWQNIAKPLRIEQRYFFAKMLVWKDTNWQNKYLIDVNFSFYYQFKQLVSYYHSDVQVCPLEQSAKVIIMDYLSFVELADIGKIAKRKLVIVDINSFEAALTQATSKKVSSADFSYDLKQVESADNPDNSEGKNITAAIETAQASVDLFFGLVGMFIKNKKGEEPYLVLNEQSNGDFEYQNLFMAAQNFYTKMSAANEILKSKKITGHLNCLMEFFNANGQLVRWMEPYEEKITLFVSPLDLYELTSKRLSPFKKIIFTASLGSDPLIKYFIGRLNIHDFNYSGIGQQELRKKFEVVIKPESLAADKLFDLVQSLDFPAAVLLPNSTALREFYEKNFKALQSRYKVYAQGYSGSTTKLLENFGFNDNGLFLATDRFVLKQVHHRLNVKNLIISRLPFEQFNHPLFAAQAAKYANQFTDFNIPRALYNFHAIIRFFYSVELEKVYILDSKINKEYGKYFLDYLRSLPFVRIISS